VNITYKYRIYPTKMQIQKLEQHFGCVRFLYNYLLSEALFYEVEGKKITGKFYKHRSTYKLLQNLRSKFCWLKEVSEESLINTLFDLELTIQKHNRNFRKGDTTKLHFRKKSDGIGSFTLFSCFYIQDNKLISEKFEEGIKIKLHREFSEEVENLKIVKNKNGEFYACFVVEKSKGKMKEVIAEETIGIDLGISSLMITSEGQKIDNKKFYEKEKSKIKFLKNKIEKRGKSKKLIKKYRALHRKITNQRKNYLQKITSKIISENQTIIIEDLGIVDLIKKDGGKLRNLILDASWGNLVFMLEYKSYLYGNNFMKINRYQASTKICSNCGFEVSKIPLNIRNWKCKNCGIKHDRDINAAKNIKQIGLKNYGVRNIH